MGIRCGAVCAAPGLVKAIRPLNKGIVDRILAKDG